MSNRTVNSLSLQVEALEERAVPAALSFHTGFLYINGTNYPDSVRVSDNSSTEVRVDMNGKGWLVPKSYMPNGIVFQGWAGDDRFENQTNFRSWAYGHQGNDTLIGGGRGDNMYGGRDNDWLEGNGGVDVLVGNENDDVLIGGADNDVLLGDGGNDYLFGSGGADRLHGGEGNDQLYGDYHTWAYLSSFDGQWGYANNRQFPDAGIDTLYGDGGHDVLDGGLDFQQDVIKPGTGRDQVVVYWHDSGSGWWEDWSTDRNQFYDQDGWLTFFSVYVDR